MLAILGLKIVWRSIIYPKGSLKILALRNEVEEEQNNMEKFLKNAVKKFKESELSVLK